jgi:hypothetical protein
MELEVNRSQNRQCLRNQEKGRTAQRYLQILSVISGETFCSEKETETSQRRFLKKMMKFRVEYKIIQRESRKSKFGLWGGRIRSTQLRQKREVR